LFSDLALENSVSDPFANADPTWMERLHQAHAGSIEALGKLLEDFRPFLNRLAEEDLDSSLRPKEGASDLVQQSFLDAHRGFKDFRGHTQAELLAWLRHILQNNLLDLARRYHGTDKRRLQREVSLDKLANADGLAGENSSVNSQANRREQWELVYQGLQRLSPEQRSAILLRHKEGKTFAEIGQVLERSEEAARKIWSRAIEELKRSLRDSNDNTPSNINGSR
jgi:RNA polymerase sigma-70 factor (ECF subfamily)